MAGNEKKTSWQEWRKSRLLREKEAIERWRFAFLVVAGFLWCVFLPTIAIWFTWTYFPLGEILNFNALQKVNDWQDVRNLVWSVGSVYGGFVILFALYLNARRTDEMRRENNISDKRQSTESYTHAIQQLGSDNPIVRMGGLYALEHIAEENEGTRKRSFEAILSFARPGTLESKPEKKNGEDTAGGTKSEKVSEHTENRNQVVEAIVRSLSRTAKEDKERESIDLSLYDLRNFRLSGLDLSRFNLSHANISSVNLRDTSLSDANLQNTNFFLANLELANLKNANLTGANLGGTALNEAYLGNANLTSANLTGADLTEANFTSANLTGANLENATFRGTNFTDTNFKNASLSAPLFYKVHLTRANLKNLNLSSAGFFEANLTGTNLSGSKLSGANLSGARNLTQKQLKDIRYKKSNPPKLPYALELPVEKHNIIKEDEEE